MKHLVLAADRFLELKAQEKAIKEELTVLGDVIKAGLDEGIEIVASNGKRATLQERIARVFRVSGKGGILALLRNHPEVDPAPLIKVVPTGVDKLPAALQEELVHTSELSHALVWK